jgi:hypothetical protein
VLSTLYRTVREDIDTPIAEGYEAVRLTREMQADLLALEPALGQHPDWEGMVRSLHYQASLYGTLAEFRAYFLRYHRWLDQGGDAAPWKLAAERFLPPPPNTKQASGTTWTSRRSSSARRWTP